MCEPNVAAAVISLARSTVTLSFRNVSVTKLNFATSLPPPPPPPPNVERCVSAFTGILPLTRPLAELKAWATLKSPSQRPWGKKCSGTGRQGENDSLKPHRVLPCPPPLADYACYVPSMHRRWPWPAAS